MSSRVLHHRSTPRRGLAARIGAVVRRFAGARDGATAVEFAMVGLPFMALLMGILELALIFIVSTNLDNATSNAARTIRTGQFQLTGGTATTFKNAICSNMSWLQNDCPTNLYVDVRVLSNFSEIPDPPVKNGVFTEPTAFSAGVACQIVEVRAFYKWTLIAPTLTQAVSNIGGGKFLMTSTLLFRNEPYTATC